MTKIYLEIALIVNKNIYEDKIINYQTYQIVENKLLQLIDKGNIDGLI